MLSVAAMFFLLAPQTPEVTGHAFPISRSFRPGRWFAIELTLASTSSESYEGGVGIRTETGAWFTTSVQFEGHEEKKVLIPVLFSQQAQTFTCVVEEQRNTFAAPSPVEHLSLLWIGSVESVETRKKAFLESAAEPFRQEVIEHSLWLEPGALPLNLATLDSTDLIWIEAQAIAGLPPGGLEVLLRWASFRGRLFSSVEGRGKIQSASFDPELVEVPGEKEKRLLPLYRIPRDPMPPLTLRDFVRFSDPAMWVLFLYLGGSIFCVLTAKTEKRMSFLALAAGGATVIVMLPGIAWPVRNHAWRTLISVARQEALIVQDRFTPDPKKNFAIPTPLVLLVPGKDQPWNGVEWKQGVASFSRMKGEVVCYSVCPSQGRKISTGIGDTVRNSFAELRSVYWALEAFSDFQYETNFPMGEALSPQAGPTVHVPLPDRPLADFLASSPKQQDWLVGQIVGEGPWDAWKPMGLSPYRTYLVAHPGR